MAQASWDFGRTPVATRMLVQTGAQHGVTPERCLEGTGLSASALDDVDGSVEAWQELAVVRNLLAGVGDRPGLGLEAGLRYTLGSAGVLGFALLSSATARDAVTIGIRYLALSSAFVRPSLELDERRARIVLDHADIPTDVRPFLIERDLAAIANILPLLMGTLPTAGLSLDLHLDTPRAELIASALPASIRVRANRPHTIIVLPRRLIDQPLPQSDTATAALCERQCQDLLDRRRARTGTADAVRSRLLRHPTAMPSMDAVAGELHVDPRTLRRHLRREGTTFRALVDEIRETLAIELLSQAGLTVEEVAHRLGYAETASFTHAFRRWRGAPPSSYRRVT